MKAIIKSTGEIIDVKPIVYVLNDNDYLTITAREIEIIEQPDWEKVRIQAAIAIDAANHASPELMQFLTTKEQFPFSKLAKVAVKAADALIEELKKKKP